MMADELSEKAVRDVHTKEIDLVNRDPKHLNDDVVKVRGRDRFSPPVAGGREQLAISFRRWSERGGSELRCPEPCARGCGPWAGGSSPAEPRDGSPSAQSLQRWFGFVCLVRFMFISVLFFPLSGNKKRKLGKTRRCLFLDFFFSVGQF